MRLDIYQRAQSKKNTRRFLSWACTANTRVMLCFNACDHQHAGGGPTHPPRVAAVRISRWWVPSSLDELKPRLVVSTASQLGDTSSSCNSLAGMRWHSTVETSPVPTAPSVFGAQNTTSTPGARSWSASASACQQVHAVLAPLHGSARLWAAEPHLKGCCAAACRARLTPLVAVRFP